MRKRIMTAAFMFLLVFGLLWSSEGYVAYADTPPAEGMFSGEVNVLKQEDGKYVMQVTVENGGEDFAGTVQAVFGANYDNCAYNTEITLPAQGKKQFTISLPERAVDTVYGLCDLNFINEEGETIQSVSLKDVFGNMRLGTSVGILSDHYSDLTFMDAGGEQFYMQGAYDSLSLIELDNDNLAGYLDGLYFLIIDRYNVSTLSEENIQAIQAWVTDGGRLILGTGEYAEQTLSGFGKDFIDVEVMDVSEPGEENIASVNADKYGYYYNYVYDAGIDFRQMAIADIDHHKMIANGSVSESKETPAVYCSVGDGAVTILYFSLGEKELQKMSAYLVQSIYQESMVNSGSYYYYDNMDMEYVGQRALSFIDSRNSDVDFTWLKVLVFIYVVLVGPVLYLILRKGKKSEWYWVGAPALGVLFVAGVYFFGRGIRVNEAKVYSVTVQQADANQKDTYFLAYQSGVEPWQIRLNDSYETAGPGYQGYYYYYSSASGSRDYFYIVGNDSEGLSVGIKPHANFDNGFLYAGGRAESKGIFSGEGLTGFNGSNDAGGTAFNGTGYDLAYMAIVSKACIMVFSDVKAGETIDIEQAVREGRCVYQNSLMDMHNLLYDMVGIYDRKDYPQEDMAALLIGIGSAMEKKRDSNDIVITGVVRDYEKAVADKCSEVSYGCFYSYVQAGTQTGRN